MKEIIIMVMILIIIIASGIGIQNYLIYSSNMLCGKLENLKTDIWITKQEQKSMETINQLANEIEEEWKEINKIWSTVILHEELDMIEMSILEVKSCIQTQNLDGGLEEIDKTIFLVGHIKEKEALKWRNIF